MPLRSSPPRGSIDRDGTTQAIDPRAFVVDTAAAPRCCVRAVARRRRPAALSRGIELDVEVGYGDAPADVPEPLRQAIRLLVAHWYENRGADRDRRTVVPCCRRPSPR